MGISKVVSYFLKHHPILNNEEILKKMENNSKFIIGLLILFLFISCKTAQKKQEKEKDAVDRKSVV